MELEQVFVLRSGTLTPESTEDLLVGNLAVADSWLVDNGKSRHLPEHYKRFKNWVLEIDPNLSGLDEFFEQGHGLNS